MFVWSPLNIQFVFDTIKWYEVFYIRIYSIIILDTFPIGVILYLLEYNGVFENISLFGILILI